MTGEYIDIMLVGKSIGVGKQLVDGIGLETGAILVAAAVDILGVAECRGHEAVLLGVGHVVTAVGLKFKSVPYVESDTEAACEVVGEDFVLIGLVAGYDIGVGSILAGTVLSASKVEHGRAVLGIDTLAVGVICIYGIYRRYLLDESECIGIVAE